MDKAPNDEISDKSGMDGFQLTSLAKEDSEKFLLDLG